MAIHPNGTSPSDGNNNRIPLLAASASAAINVESGPAWILALAVGLGMVALARPIRQVVLKRSGRTRLPRNSASPRPIVHQASE